MSLRSEGSVKSIGMDLNLPAASEESESHSEISYQGESEKKRPSILELLNQYGSEFKRLKGKKLCTPSYNTVCGGTGTLALSTEEVMKVARARVIEYFPHSSNNPRKHPNDSKHVELALHLIASAEKVSNQQYDQARELLNMCDTLSSVTGDPVQRVVYYFVEALREKIGRETGTIASRGLKDEEIYQLNIEEEMMSPNPTMIACINELPFIQPTQFTGIQAIVENVVKAKRVHVIDLEIRTGVQWTVLMQALVTQHDRPLEHLKITAVATPTSKLRIHEICKNLMDFAKTINLPLSFKMVMISDSDFKDLTKDAFEFEADEVVAIYSALFLKTLLRKPECLDSLMTVIQNIQPCVMVIIEVEANDNSLTFMDRFLETLFYYSAIFDSIEACMDRMNPNRMPIESIYLSHRIRNIVVAEGEERRCRHENLDYWRGLFARFGMVETELSTSSLYQANLVVRKFPCGSSCTLTMNGKCLFSGWKGKPIYSVSVWKFQQEGEIKEFEK